MAETVVWGVHAGKTGDAHSLFLDHGVVALGWSKIGDLSKLKATRDDFKAAVAHAYPDSKPGAIPTNAGQLYRFLHELQVADILAYPSKSDRLVHLGRVEGGYLHNPTLSSGYPNQREVKWCKALPRTQFSQGALYELGSAMSFFQIKTYAEEYRSALEGKAAPPPPKEDTSVAFVAEEIEQTTRDFVLKTLSQELKGHPLSDFIAHLLNTMGYRTRVSDPGPDGGIDIIAHRDELGFEPPIIKVQVKSGDGNVGDPMVSALYGKVGGNEHGLLITLGTFTSQAKAFAKSKSNLRLIDGNELVDLILAHYEQLDSRYKGILPLKRVWVPESIEDEQEQT
jgi:restriction system protein